MREGKTPKSNRLVYWEPTGTSKTLERLIKRSGLLYLVSQEKQAKETSLVKDLRELAGGERIIPALPLLSKEQDKETILAELERLNDFPVEACVLIANPLVVSRNFLKEAQGKGLTHLGIPLDVGAKNLFKEYHPVDVKELWSIYCNFIKTGAEVFGTGRVNVHLFAGLGETEEEFIATMQEIDDFGGVTTIFSANKNKELKLNPVSIGKYRRLQLARYLLQEKLVTIKQMQFNQFGSVFEFGVHPSKLEEFLQTGLPFCETGNYPLEEVPTFWPGHDNYFGGVRNFQKELTKEEASLCKGEFFAVDWREEWQLVARKVQREGVGFAFLNSDLGFTKLGFVPGITEEDLRYVKGNNQKNQLN